MYNEYSPFVDDSVRISACAIADIALHNHYENQIELQKRWRLLTKNVVVETNNSDFKTAFLWARWSLDKLLTNDTLLIASSPFLPEVVSWQNILALPGITATDRSPQRAYIFLQKTVEHNTSAPLEGEVKSYDPHLNLGLTAMISEKLSEMEPPIDSSLVPLLTDLLFRRFRDLSISYSIGSDITSQGFKDGDGGLRAGLYLTKHNDGYSSYKRNGPRIEDQVLLGKISQYIDAHFDLLKHKRDIPSRVFKGISSWYRKGRSEYAPRAVNGKGYYLIPLNTRAALNKYKDHQTGQWYDHLEFESETDLNPKGVSTQTVMHNLALGWNKPGSADLSRDLLANAYDVGLIGEAGFRSLASSDTGYNPAHVYLEERNGFGTTGKGDVLIWTAGRLAEMFRLTNNLDSLWMLVDRLNYRILETGVVGGLHEAENGDPQPVGDNITGNRLHVTALAEYIRLVHDYILGLPWSSGEMIRLKPRLPPDWGVVEVDFKYNSGRISYKRITETEYEVAQQGLDPPVTISLEILPTEITDEEKEIKKAVWSRRMHDGDAFHVKFIRTKRGAWKTEAEEL